MATWYKLLCGYHIRCWNEDNLRLDHPYLVDCMTAKKYAFAADFVRFQILREHGGIYLDTDMEIVQSFDDMLDLTSFIGYEDAAIRRPSAGVIGSIPHSDFSNKVADHYYSLSASNSMIVCDVLKAVIDRGVNGLTIFPEQVFYPFNPYSTRPFKRGGTLMASDIKSDTRAVHHWLKSWG